MQKQIYNISISVFVYIIFALASPVMMIDLFLSISPHYFEVCYKNLLFYVTCHILLTTFILTFFFLIIVKDSLEYSESCQANNSFFSTNLFQQEVHSFSMNYVILLHSYVIQKQCTVFHKPSDPP